MSRAKIIDFYLEQAKDPNFDLSQIRKDMEAKEFEEEEIRTIVNFIDNQLQRQAEVELKKVNRTKLIVGGIISALGTISALIYYLSEYL